MDYLFNLLWFLLVVFLLLGWPEPINPKLNVFSKFEGISNRIPAFLFFVAIAALGVFFYYAEFYQGVVTAGFFLILLGSAYVLARCKNKQNSE